MGRQTRRNIKRTANHSVRRVFSTAEGIVPLTSKRIKELQGPNPELRFMSKLDTMLRKSQSPPYTFVLGGKEVRFIYVRAHGSIIGNTTCPPDVGIIQTNEGDYRGLRLKSSMAPFFLNVILGHKRTSRDALHDFFEVKTGHSVDYPIEQRDTINSISYATPGMNTFNYKFGMGSVESDPLNAYRGAWDVTKPLATSTFDPNDFTVPALRLRLDGPEGGSLYENPAKAKEYKAGGLEVEVGIPRKYTQIPMLRDMMATGGATKKSLLRSLKSHPYYKDKLCIVIIFSCTGWDETLTNEGIKHASHKVPAITGFGYNAEYEPKERDPSRASLPGQYVTIYGETKNPLYGKDFGNAQRDIIRAEETRARHLAEGRLTDPTLEVIKYVKKRDGHVEVHVFDKTTGAEFSYDVTSLYESV